MIVGAAVIPAAPLLVPGLSATLPDGVERVADAVDAALDSLPAYDTAVLLACSTPQEDASAPALHTSKEASLAGVGRPDIVRVAVSPSDDGPAAAHRAVLDRVSRMTQYPLHSGQPLPLGLTVLGLLVGGHVPLVAAAVPRGAGFGALVGVGAGIAEALDDTGVRAVAVASGDLSAGLDEHSPLYRVDGAREWDDRVATVVDSGRLDGLADLGPQEAGRVGSLGWAPLAVLHGACARAKVGLVLRHYSAPRGVGYLVAQGA